MSSRHNCIIQRNRYTGYLYISKLCLSRLSSQFRIMVDFIDLFCGAGGLSAGLADAGFNCVAAVEINRDACDTFSRSHQHTKLHDCSIANLDFSRYQGISLLAGGPPCQPFSAGGKGLAAADSRDMVPAFIRAVREARPEVFMMENVPGLSGPSHRTYLDAVLEELRQLDYKISMAVVNAAEYGVPQKRRRLIVIGTKVGRSPFVFPRPTHGPRGVKPYVSAGSVISSGKGAGEPNRSRVTFAKHPDLRPSPYDGHLFNGGGRAINLLAPCHTILASAGGNKTHFIDLADEVPAYHQHLINGGAPKTGSLEGGRRLTLEESASLQTFPDGMAFAGSRSSQYAQIGNAVPPVLAKAIGMALAAQFKT